MMHIMPRMVRLARQPWSTIERVRKKRLRRTLAHAVRHSPFYRKLYAGIDVGRCPLTDLPPVTKEMMMENFDEVVTDRRITLTKLQRWLDDVHRREAWSERFLGKYNACTTSGTTGIKAYVLLDAPTVDRYIVAMLFRTARKNPLPWWKLGASQLLCLVGKKPHYASILVDNGPKPGITLTRSIPRATQRFGQHRLFPLQQPMNQLVEQLNEYAPIWLTTYPSLLSLLAREQLAGRLHLKFDSPFSNLCSGAEPLTQDIRSLCREAWSVEIQDTYGAAECHTMARSCCEFDRMHILSDLCHLEIVDENHRPVPDGQHGRKVLLTNFYSRVQPFIRYELTDVTGISVKPCPCGSPFPTLLPVEGRTTDLFYLSRPGGGYDLFHPYSFLHPMEAVTSLKQFQIVQTARDVITLNFVPIENADPDDIARAVRAGAARVLDEVGLGKHPVEIRPLCCDEIPRDPVSGKFRLIYAAIPPPDDLD